MLKVGDEVYLEDCWEDIAGRYYDEYLTVTKVYEDGRCRFHLDTAYPEHKRQKIQAWINKFDYYAKDYEPLPKVTQ